MALGGRGESPGGAMWGGDGEEGRSPGLGETYLVPQERHRDVGRIVGRRRGRWGGGC